MKKTLLCIVSMLLVVAMLISCAPKAAENPSTEQKPAAASNQNAPAAKTETKTEQSQPNAGTPKEGGVLKIAQLANVNDYSWYGGLALRDNCSLSFCMESLLEYDQQTGEIKPYLVDWYKMDETNMTLTMKAKEGIYFHDGSEFNAEVIKWCIEYYRDNSKYGTQYLGNVAEVNCLDKYTVEFKLSSQNIALLFNLTNRAGMMYSKQAFDTYGVDYTYNHPVGTGPFVFKEWIEDEKIVYEKNPNYWNGPVYLDGVEVHIYNESLVAQAAFEAKEIDVIYGENFELAPASDLKAAGYHWQPYAKSEQLYVVGFNCQDEDDPFHDIRVRQAVCYAIDSETINEQCNYGFATLTNQWALPGSPYYNPEVKGFEYNPEKAKELLKEAGYENGFDTQITFKYNDNLLELGTIIQGYLAKIGINVKLNRLESAAFVNKINDWDYGMILHTATYEPAVTTKFKGMYAKTVLESTALALGKGCFLHPDDLDAAVEGAVHSFTSADEQKHIREAQVLLQDKYVLWYPIFSLSDICFVQDYVKDWTYLDTGLFGEGSAHVWLDK